jgi:hypothetical protein
MLWSSQLEDAIPILPFNFAEIKLPSLISIEKVKRN